MKKNYNFNKKAICLNLVFLFVGLLGFAQNNHVINGGGCTTPVISATDGPGTICEGNTATLTATHNGDTVNWYDAETGDAYLGSGSPFETDILTTTTSFWAEAVNGGSGTPVTGAARVAPASNSNSAVNPGTAPWGLAFDASEAFTINSVDVYLASSTPSDLVVQLKDNSLSVLEEITISLPAGSSSSPVVFTAPLDFFVPTGTNYNLVADSSPVLVREFSSEHPGFPYPLGSVGSVTGGTINDNDANSTVYYFFYNWTVTAGAQCVSARAEEVVTVTPSPDAPTGASTQFIVPGDPLSSLSVTGENLRWYSDSAGTNEIPDTTPMEDLTTYYVSQTVNGCESDLLAITVVAEAGVEDNLLSGITFYPNPVADILTIQYKEKINHIIVINMLGQNILDMYNNSTLEVEVNLSSLTQGTYFIKVFSGDKTFTERVIKK